MFDSLLTLSPLLVLIGTLFSYIYTDNAIYLNFFILAGIFGWLANVIFKRTLEWLSNMSWVPPMPWIYRPNKNPAGHYCDSDRIGMPSGHAQFWAFTVVYWALQTGQWPIVLIITAIMVDYSRVKVKCHNLLQIIVGSILGAGLAYSAVTIL